jgi:hypothetical protein
MRAEWFTDSTRPVARAGLRHRFLDEHVTAHLHRPDREVPVRRRRRQDVHDVRLHLRELIQRLEHRRNTKLRGDRVRLLLIGVGNADDGDVLERFQGPQVVRADVARADDGGPKGRFHSA